MKQKKLVIVDLDQTLLDSPKQQLPSQEFINAVESIRENIVVGCATGRAYSWALPVLEAANFTALCILGGGAIIVEPENYEFIEQRYIPSSQLMNIKNIAANYPKLGYLFNDYTEKDYESGGWNLERFLKSKKCTLLDIVGISHEQANYLIEKFNTLNDVQAVKMNGYKVGLVDILVTHRNASKTNAIRTVQKRLNIEKANTIGIGNGYNDLQIFESVGTKVAVGNSIDELKNAADEIIGSVSTDPIPSFLRKLNNEAF